MELSTTENLVTKPKEIFSEGWRILLGLCQLLSIFFYPVFIIGRDINSNSQTSSTSISSPQKSNSPLILNSLLCCPGEGNKPKRHWGKSAEGVSWFKANLGRNSKRVPSESKFKTLPLLVQVSIFLEKNGKNLFI